MKILNIGIIGMGGFGRFHAEMINQHPGAQVTAYTAKSEESAAAAKRTCPQAKRYLDYHEMIDSEQLDAVFICVQPDAHEDMEEYAAAKGISLYVEKPLGLSLEQAKKKERAITEHQIICSVGYQERYHPHFAALKDRLAGCEPSLILARWLGSTPGVSWWSKKARSGGQVVEQTTHLFDMLYNFFGEFESVFALAIPCSSKVPGADVEDASSAIIKFKNGSIANISSADYLDDEKVPGDVGISIYLTDEQIHCGWDGTVTYKRRSETIIKKFTQSRHELAVDAFIRAVQTGNRDLIKTSYSDGVKVLAATLAVNESIAAGVPVFLP